MTLGERLTCLRKQKNLSQEEVANKLNVSRQTISKWELDQSLPDFDKIMPICNLYEITSEELLTGIKSVQEENTVNQQDEKAKQLKRARGLVLAIALYFVAVVWTMVSVAALNINPVIGGGGFMLIAGIATCIIIYTQIVYKKSLTNTEKKQNKTYKQIQDIASVATLIIYLLVSFVTMAWQITWIIWIVYALVMKIVKLILSLKGEEIEDE